MRQAILASLFIAAAACLAQDALDAKVDPDLKIGSSLTFKAAPDTPVKEPRYVPVEPSTLNMGLQTDPQYRVNAPAEPRYERNRYGEYYERTMTGFTTGTIPQPHFSAQLGRCTPSRASSMNALNSRRP